MLDLISDQITSRVSDKTMDIVFNVFGISVGIAALVWVSINSLCF